jgi:hypothetical protein
VDEALAALDRPAARQRVADGDRLLRLADVAAHLASDALVVDACRRGLGVGAAWRPLARRPVLFALARALAEAWPGDAERDALIAEAFRMRHPTRRTGRACAWRSAACARWCQPLARIEATARGFALSSAGGTQRRRCWQPPDSGEQASLLALAGRRRALVHVRAGAGPGGAASAPCSARSADWRPKGARVPSAGPVRSAGWLRRWPDSRRSCYSPRRSHLDRVLPAAQGNAPRGADR